MPPERPRRSRPSRGSFRPRELLGAGVNPSKSLGQHFLTDQNIVAKIIAACELSQTDVVIEVGAGLGVLTEGLLEAAGRVIAVEFDGRLCERLRERFGGALNLTLVEGDVLAVEPAMLLQTAGLAPQTDYAVAASLPYNIGAAVLRHFLEASHRPRWLVVMLQREVAASVTAEPGRLGLLGISVQVYAQPRRLFDVSPGAFYPAPKVVSSVLRLDVRPEPLVPLEERSWFFELVRAGFSARRKQLRNSLAQGLGCRPSDLLPALSAAGVDPTARPEAIGIEDWLLLSRQIERRNASSMP